MTDKTIELQIGKINGDFFLLSFRRKYGYNLKYYLDQFNPEDYWIYKSTGRQRLVGPEWVDWRWSGYIFFKKELYDKEDINKWIDFIWSFSSLMYLSKPFPPIELMKKIKIIK